ncbi:hypothetical protein [Bradyrhizobium sp. 1]|uniref:hypothetical protein n=1 Tax=Bradyrhizobium sp. 1 TaxID=241591 RepID=UPI001FF7D406|nr:hypothetical protein [Bradyrhizobium sp. 1]MCK1393674.1 hypothetical protein [Bradyrhizobium sp. 1]
MTEPANNPAANSTGAFDNLFAPAKEWGAFSAQVLSIAAVAAYAYEWGYGAAIGFDILSTTSVTDRASEWRVLWPIVLAIFAGRLLTPPWGDMSDYPEWALKVRDERINAFALIPFIILFVLFITMMFVPAFRETHPETGDDPSGIAAYSFGCLLLMFVSSPIFEVKFAALGRIGRYIAMLLCTILFAHFLGSSDGDDILNQRVRIPLACLGENATARLVGIVRSFDSGSLLLNQAGKFYWMEAKDTRKLEVLPPSAASDQLACARH